MAVRKKEQYGGGPTDLSAQLKVNPRPPAPVVQDFHLNADTDTSLAAIHHTLGASQNQSSPGDHTHDGGSSPLILTGFSLSGSRGGNAAMTSLIACLVRLGATDETTT